MKTPLRGVPAAPGVAHARIWRLPEASDADGSPGADIGLEQAAERAAAELESLEQRLRTGGRADESETGPAGGCGAQDRGDVFVSETQVRRSIEQQLGPLLPVDRAQESGVGPAVVYRVARGEEGGEPRGRVGFISAMSAPFCSTCNRLRLTATGVLRSCLFEGGEVNIRPLLRSTPDRATRLHAIASAMTDCVRLKPDVHSRHGNEQMSRIGG